MFDIDNYSKTIAKNWVELWGEDLTQEQLEEAYRSLIVCVYNNLRDCHHIILS